MAQLAHEVAGEDFRIATLTVRKGNVDYLTGASWASHENYLHRRDPVYLRPALIPHLVSRILFTGSGGYDPFTTACPRFVLSPRALFVRRLVASSATREIALVDDRAQPHCNGFHRQHIMCGDANQSQLAMLLRIGTTALVVALIDANCARDEAMKLADPMKALETIIHDVTLRAPVDLASGRRLLAVEIQRHYLGLARAHSDRLPAWSTVLCDVWEDTLDRLDRGPEAVADRLDWAIKHVIHRDRSTSLLFNDNAKRAELCEIDVRFAAGVSARPVRRARAIRRAASESHRNRSNRAGDIDASLVRSRGHPRPRHRTPRT
jgi:proteasome accessory factor A